MTMQSPTLATVKLACHFSQPTPTIDWPAVFASSAPLLTLPRAGSCFIKRRIVLQAGSGSEVVTPLHHDYQVVEHYLISSTATALDELVTVPWVAYARSSDGLECMVQPDLNRNENGGLIDLHTLMLVSHNNRRHLQVLTLPVARALQQLHQCGIIHNDLTLNHIYCTPPYDASSVALLTAPPTSRIQVKIVDYDLATFVDDSMAHGYVYRGTWEYASVAVQLGMRPSFSSDYESLIYVLLSFSKQHVPWIAEETELQNILRGSVDVTDVTDIDGSTPDQIAWITLVGDYKLYWLLSNDVSASTLSSNVQDAVYALASGSDVDAARVIHLIERALSGEPSSSPPASTKNNKRKASSIDPETDQSDFSLQQVRQLYADTHRHGNPYHVGNMQLDLASTGAVHSSLSGLYDVSYSGLMLPHYATPQPVVSDAWVLTLPQSTSQAQVFDAFITVLYTVNAALAAQCPNPLALARASGTKVLLVFGYANATTYSAAAALQRTLHHAVNAYQQSNYTFCLPHVRVLAALDRLQVMVDTAEQRSDVAGADPLQSLLDAAAFTH